MVSGDRPGPQGRGRRSPSAARLAGDDYQHLVAWSWALRALLPGSDVAAVEVEAPDTGNVDDVVLWQNTPPHQYLQAKYAVDARSPVNTGWLTRRSPSGGPSLLQRFHASWQRLRVDGPEPDLWLVTNRDLDPADPAVIGRDNRTQTIAAALAAARPTSAAGLRRAEWAAHLQTSEHELLELLWVLRFDTGRGYASEHRHAAELMAALGLRSDDQAVNLGIGLVRGWVVEGRTRFDRADLQAEIDALQLRTADPWCVLLVQAIDRDPHPEDATVRLDWVDRFTGDTAAARRRPHDPAVWEPQLRPELRRAVAQLRAVGCQRTLVRGPMRLATWFTVGFECAQVTGMAVACHQGGRLWTSDTPAVTEVQLNVQETLIGRGDELAVVVAIAYGPSVAVRQYLEAAGVPVARLATLSPATRPSDQAVTGPGQAVALAQVIRNRIRQLADASRTPRLHLVLACPAGLALLLGHRWNRVPTTQLYEDLGLGALYTPSFLLQLAAR
jgi:SMODS-associated and fused to various effectors sensor domain